jgi:carbon-monoxide dehydrogenase medium subunit
MDYFEPKTIDEALSLLDRYGDRAEVIAGGTDVMVDIKYKEEPECLVNIKRIPDLNTIRENGAGLIIGPLTTIHELEESSLVKERLPLLWQAAHQFASLQIRNTATIGGNICRASPSGETLTPLLVLEAQAKVAFSRGVQGEPFASFFKGPGQTSLGSKGLLTDVEVPYPAAGSSAAYLKHAVRGPMDIAMVGVAVMITPDANKTKAEDVRIGLGAVAPTPIRASKTEAMLEGKTLTAALVKEAGTMAGSESSPISDQRSSGEYRKWIVEALTRRGLAQCWQTITGKEVAS